MDRVKSPKILIFTWYEFFAQFGTIMMFKAFVSNGLAQAEKAAENQVGLRKLPIYLYLLEILPGAEPCGGLLESKKRNDLRRCGKRVYKLSNRRRMEGMLRQDSPESKGTETELLRGVYFSTSRCGRIPTNVYVRSQQQNKQAGFCATRSLNFGSYAGHRRWSEGLNFGQPQTCRSKAMRKLDVPISSSRLIATSIVHLCPAI